MPTMEVALVGGARTRPAPGLKGLCQFCGKPTRAKCGSIIRWHWAHASRRNCDPWMENEGPWHRGWKALFPLEWQEVIAYDDSGEKHIADVKRPDGTVIELQNSPMSTAEMFSREAFYGEKMIWIVNGEKFKNHIRIGDALPDPNHPKIQDFKLALPVFTPWPKYWSAPRHDGSGFVYFLKSDLAAATSPGDLFLAHHGKAFDGVVEESYCGQHMWSWRRPRLGWLNSRRTVIFDLAENGMWALAKLEEDKLPCLQKVSRRRFLESLLNGESPNLTWAVEPYTGWM